MRNRHILSGLFKLLPVFILTLAFFMNGCSTSPQQADNSENNTEQRIETPDTVLKGSTLLELGLTVDLEKLKTFKDPNYPDSPGYQRSYGIWYVSSNEIHLISDAVSENTDISMLAIYYTPDRISMEVMPTLYLQGFKKPPATEKEPFIEIGSTLYASTELSQYKIYEDDNYFVLDIRDLLETKDFNDMMDWHTQQWADGYDFGWLKEVYSYLKTYEDIHITVIE